jgi:hypothetical protein
MTQPKINTDKNFYSSTLSQQISETYWQNVDGKFSFRVEELAKKFDLSAKEITAIALNSHTYINFGICKACGHENTTAVVNRTRAKQVLDNLYYYFFCSLCRANAKEFCKKLNDMETKIVWMRLSFKYQLWNELNNDEMNFLKAIYYLKDWNRIYNEIIKLDMEYSFKVLFKLDKMNLIYYMKDELTGQVRIKILDELQNLIKIKSI